MSPTELASILQRAARHDPDAFAALYEAYAPRVYGLLVRMVRSRDLAEDLLQDTFLRVARMISEYSHDGRFEAWLFRIAANLARDHVRKVGRRGTMTPLDAATDDSDPWEPADTRDGSPDAGLDRQEQVAALEAAIAELPDDDREIVLLRHYADLPFREIAELMGAPLGTVLARGHRALKKLRAKLADEE